MPRIRTDVGSIKPHPAVALGNIITATRYNHTGPCASVTCPNCKKKRLVPLRTIKHQTAKPYFTGSCRECWSNLPKAREFRTKRNPSGKRLTDRGYVALGKNAIDDADLDLFNLMRQSAGYVLEHRWVMAKHLDRAIESNELIDHMDGDKINNNVSNLRIYVRGKQQPGSAPGHGTFYHELQQALKEIKHLKSLLQNQ